LTSWTLWIAAGDVEGSFGGNNFHFQEIQDQGGAECQYHSPTLDWGILHGQLNIAVILSDIVFQINCFQMSFTSTTVVHICQVVPITKLVGSCLAWIKWMSSLRKSMNVNFLVCKLFGKHCTSDIICIGIMQRRLSRLLSTIIDWAIILCYDPWQIVLFYKLSTKVAGLDEHHLDEHHLM